MDLSLNGRVALVTGASRGIGRAIAFELAAAGADVALLSRTEEGLAAARAEVEAAGRRALGIPCDLQQDRAGLAAAVRRATQALGPIDILVNNAGITEGMKFSAMELSRWDRIMAVNLEAPAELCRLVVESMAERGFGRIINVASIAARTGARYAAAYTASKHGLLGLSRSVALDYAARGVTVNVVCPGWVATDMQEEAITNITEKTRLSREEALARLLEGVPQRRLIEPREVAAAVAFLASPAASGITGQALNVDGGAVLS